MASNAALGSPGQPTSRTLCGETTRESSRARRGWGQKEQKVKKWCKIGLSLFAMGIGGSTPGQQSGSFKGPVCKVWPDL